MSITPEQFATIYPKFEDWVDALLRSVSANAQAVATVGFRRLPEYFRSETLEHARFVVHNAPLPTPPLTAWGFPQYADFEEMDPDGITYMNTYFVRPNCAQSERLHFHELIHVVQWSLLGRSNFAALYLQGLETHGYRASPLEVMAYNAEERFATDPKPFDVERHVANELRRICG